MEWKAQLNSVPDMCSACSCPPSTRLCLGKQCRCADRLLCGFESGSLLSCCLLSEWQEREMSFHVRLKWLRNKCLAIHEKQGGETHAWTSHRQLDLILTTWRSSFDNCFTTTPSPLSSVNMLVRSSQENPQMSCRPEEEKDSDVNSMPRPQRHIIANEWRPSDL